MTIGRSIATRSCFRLARAFSALMFETGIKVIDLLEPYVQGGKILASLAAPVSARPFSSRR